MYICRVYSTVLIYVCEQSEKMMILFYKFARVSTIDLKIMSALMQLKARLNIETRTEKYAFFLIL